MASSISRVTVWQYKNTNIRKLVKRASNYEEFIENGESIRHYHVLLYLMVTGPWPVEHVVDPSNRNVAVGIYQPVNSAFHSPIDTCYGDEFMSTQIMTGLQ